MVRRLREKAAAAGLAVRAEVADMRGFEMGRRYALIFCGFNGFAHCETTPDQLAFLRAALAAPRAGRRPGHPHVLSRSRLLVRARRPSRPRARGAAARRRQAPAVGQPAEETSSPSGRIPRWRSGSSTPRTGRRPCTSSRRSSAGSIRFELELLFAAAGFARWQILGGFDGRPLRRPRRPDGRPGVQGLRPAPRRSFWTFPPPRSMLVLARRWPMMRQLGAGPPSRSRCRVGTSPPARRRSTPEPGVDVEVTVSGQRRPPHRRAGPRLRGQSRAPGSRTPSSDRRPRALSRPSGPSVARFPGGNISNNYCWVEQKVSGNDHLVWEDWSWGIDVDQYIAFLKAVGCVPMFSLNPFDHTIDGATHDRG
ncbi:MAG: hypothetical protein M0C28_07415 [Candidatus Moduliflexus flocculans]|nr:hypothetical protein [Candidatus Moduliflexus flocculans]